LRPSRAFDNEDLIQKQLQQLQMHLVFDNDLKLTTILYAQMKTKIICHKKQKNSIGLSFTILLEVVTPSLQSYSLENREVAASPLALCKRIFLSHDIFCKLNLILLRNKRMDAQKFSPSIATFTVIVAI